MERPTAQLGFAESLLFNTVRIEAGTFEEVFSIGTAFLFELEVEGKPISLVATCRHVVDDTTNWKLRFTKMDDNNKPMIGDTFSVELQAPEFNWIFHPDPEIDLCILPFNPIRQLAAKQGVKLFTIFTDEVSIISSQNLEQIDAIEDIVMIGYPIGLWDKHNNLPLARKGITATHPLYDYNGKPEFVIDAACFGGSSGSPVFLFKPGSTLRLKHESQTRQGNHASLMGLLYAGPQDIVAGQITVGGKITVEKSPTQPSVGVESQIPIHLGYVIKASKLLDFKEIISNLLQQTQNNTTFE